MVTLSFTIDVGFYYKLQTYYFKYAVITFLQISNVYETRKTIILSL